MTGSALAQVEQMNVSLRDIVVIPCLVCVRQRKTLQNGFSAIAVANICPAYVCGIFPYRCAKKQDRKPTEKLKLG